MLDKIPIFFDTNGGKLRNQWDGRWSKVGKQHIVHTQQTNFSWMNLLIDNYFVLKPIIVSSRQTDARERLRWREIEVWRPFKKRTARIVIFEIFNWDASFTSWRGIHITRVHYARQLRENEWRFIQHLLGKKCFSPEKNVFLLVSSRLRPRWQEEKVVISIRSALCKIYETSDAIHIIIISIIWP